jgi:hypothetical protein
MQSMLAMDYVYNSKNPKIILFSDV